MHRRSGATSSTGVATCARTRSSSHAVARTTATSATRTRSIDGGISFYTQAVDHGPGRDRADARQARVFPRRPSARQPALRRLPCSTGCAGMGRVFQGASTVDAILRSGPDRARGRLRACAACSSVSRPSTRENLAASTPSARTSHAITTRSIRRVHDLGIMINASFVFGLDDDGPDVFDRTVDWAVSRSIETATFHIMTPYPGTALHDRVSAEGRITDLDWDHLRHASRRVSTAAGIAPDALLGGLPPRVPRLLCVGLDLPRRVRPVDRPSHGATPCLCRRVEAARAAMGRDHPLAAGQRDAAAPRVDARCVRAGTSRERRARHKKLRASPGWGRPCACRGGRGRWHRTYRCRRSGRRRRAAARRRDGGQGPRPRGGHRRRQRA